MKALWRRWFVLFLVATAWAQDALVSVTCGHTWLSVAVPAGLLGSRVASGELTLGAGCGVTAADGDRYWLEHPLEGCGTTLELLPDSIRYSNILHYRPSPGGPVARAGPFSLPVDCHYPRTGSVSSGAIQPTWVPFGSTVAHRRRCGSGAGCGGRRRRLIHGNGGLLGEASGHLGPLGLLSPLPTLSPGPSGHPTAPTTAPPRRPSVPVVRGEKRDSGPAVPGTTLAMVAMCSILVAVGTAGCYCSVRRHRAGGSGAAPGEPRAVAMAPTAARGATAGTPPAPAAPASV
ncbi:uncharacterized protein [Nyctibius grandis]|uniref:uncharacterized protein n=1 Tax=Nyctibius grandis TaxID=48427 RepID=UPI0035BBC419